MAREHFSSTHSESDQTLDPTILFHTTSLLSHNPRVGTSYSQIHWPDSAISGDLTLDNHLGPQHMDLLCQNKDPSTWVHN